MAEIRFPTATAGQIFTTGPFGSGSSPYEFDYSFGRLYIMQGAIATRNDMDTTAPASFRGSDRLIGFATAQLWTQDAANNSVILGSPVQQTAAASGTASWFWLVAFYSTGGIGVTNQLVGTVTGPGGGGDLIVNTTSIVSGHTYTLGQISFTMPTTFIS